jgi:hypothetical protein
VIYELPFLFNKLENKMIKTIENVTELFETRTELKSKLYFDATIYSIIKHVSQSGMTRHISFFHIWGNEPYFLTRSISDLLGYKMNKHHDAIIVGGCGMDMAWSVVNNLEYELNKDIDGIRYKFKSRII